MAIKQLKAVSKHYDVIPSIFQDGNARRLQAEIEEGKQIWEEVRQTSRRPVVALIAKHLYSHRMATRIL